MKKLLLILGAALMLGGSLQAATLAITEGNRDLVLGTTALAPTDSTNGPPGNPLGTVGFGGGVDVYDQIDVHGRIVGAADFYNFTATSSFTIEFIFDGVTTAEDGLIASGFVREGNGGNTSNFILNLNGGSVGPSPLSFSTDITSVGDNGGTSLIFSGTAGTLYTFAIDSGVPSPSNAATYDIRISAVPLPAGVLLLLSGLGAMGIVRRRKR